MTSLKVIVLHSVRTVPDLLLIPMSWLYDYTCPIYFLHMEKTNVNHIYKQNNCDFVNSFIINLKNLLFFAVNTYFIK